MLLQELCYELKNSFSAEFFILLSFCTIIFLTIAIIYSFLIKKKYDEVVKIVNVNKYVTESLSYDNEIVAFDKDNNIIYSTHPDKYKSKSDFINYLNENMALTMNLKSFCDALENNEQFHTILKYNNSNFPKKLITSNYVCTDGNKLLSITIMTDITEHCIKTDELMHSYKKLETFIDNLPLGVFYIDNNGKILGCNITFATYLKISRDNIIGASIHDFIENFELNKIYTDPLKVILKSKYFAGIQVFLIKPPLTSFTSHQPLIVIKISDILTEFHPENTDDLFKQSSIAAIIIDKTGNIYNSNKAFAKLIDNNDLVQQNILSLITKSSDVKNTKEDLTKALSNLNNYQPLELQLNYGNSKKTIKVYISQIVSNYFLIQIIDISDQKFIEQQFLQSQKIQSIGQLTSGIAHDFNNLLTAMIGFCDLLLQRYIPEDPSFDDVMQIKQNAERAANLVRQLLAFSRQQTLKTQVVVLNNILLELFSLLKRLVGQNIDFKLNISQKLWSIKIDIGQFEQIVMNLVVNARDALNNKGELTIQLRNFYSDNNFECVDAIAKAGDYVLLEVIDTGCGMDKETLAHIFEPFYSRKIKNIKNSTVSGTGLGLATVYGIVNQTGGYIKVESEVNKGTNFKVFFPRYNGPNTVSNLSDTSLEDLSGSETILIVEDEDAVRNFIVRALTNKGYKMIEASNGIEALKIIKHNKIDLLVTDVIMPKIDGPTLNKKLREIRGDFKTIFISGYTEDTFRQDINKNSEIYFIQKPFTLKEFVKKVRDVLNHG